MDERVTLKQQDKIPYGMSVARRLVPELFPKAKVYYDEEYPGYWNAIDTDDTGQLLILVADYMDVNGRELEHLSGFIQKGNSLFIISRYFSYELSSEFNFLNTESYSSDNVDSLSVTLNSQYFPQASVYSYSGKNYSNSFAFVDTSKAITLGTNTEGESNFIKIEKGAGTLYIHSAPLAFSNYFLLQKNNVEYFENVFSVLPQNTRTIVWNEYFLNKALQKNEKEPEWLSIFLQYDGFRWGFFIAVVTLLLFVLLNMRRQQRMIPAFEKPKNDSLDFIKTLGRLYYDKKDHRNLALKLSLYFLEYIRTTYKIPSHSFDDEFIQTLHFRSGYSLPELQSIFQEIKRLKTGVAYSEMDLAQFHNQLELFYQKA